MPGMVPVPGMNNNSAMAGMMPMNNAPGTFNPGQTNLSTSVLQPPQNGPSPAVPNGGMMGKANARIRLGYRPHMAHQIIYCSYPGVRRCGRCGRPGQHPNDARDGGPVRAETAAVAPIPAALR